MNPFTRKVLFFLFFLSGFCGLVYQVVWTRMAFASFGIITPVLSVVLSVFMSGLAVGSWLGGRWIQTYTIKNVRPAIFCYAAAEFLIGLGAFAVPLLFRLGERVLLGSGGMDSFQYLFFSALVLAISIFPFCLCMGTTFPFMMAFIRQRDAADTQSFSFLYLANVLGAISGVLLTAMIWIEMMGFRHCLWLAAAGNFVIAFVSICLGWEPPKTDGSPAPAEMPTVPKKNPLPESGFTGRNLRLVLFSTGFVAMAMEVVWTRAFTPVMKTQVYSFAWIVFAYLAATFLGSFAYRLGIKKSRVASRQFLILGLAISALLPVIANDSRFVVADWAGVIKVKSVVILLLSIVPVCALLGYLTPLLIDESSRGNPAAAGRAYAINVLGCVLGPLFACYFLLPYFSERHALVILSIPFLIFCLPLLDPNRWRSRLVGGTILAAALISSLFGVHDFESTLMKSQTNTAVRRDYAASVISFGEGSNKHLLVNGIGMTVLTPITKFIVHLPMAFHQGPPRSILVICFGMGTSFRSALSWDVDTTTVELVPSVVESFGFYHADAASFLADPKGHVVIDDGRRFLRRTGQQYDVITVDPPPPVWAAGSSLLYSREFYALAKQRLKPGGILQIWYPGGEPATAQAVVRSLVESFPHVRCFGSIARGGLHLLASMDPIEKLDAGQLVAKMPPGARNDLLEWSNTTNAPAYLQQVLDGEVDPTELSNPDPEVQITDDRPFNEYFLLRQWIQ